MSDDDLIRRGSALDAVRLCEFRWQAEDAIAAVPAVTVGVKPLVWEQISDRTIEAAGVGSTYRIQTMPDGGARWQSRYMGEWHNAPSVDAAKDAINMFHRAALSQFVTIAALEPVAAPDPAAIREAAQVERMQNLIDAYEDIMDYGIVFAKKDQQDRLKAAKEKME